MAESLSVSVERCGVIGERPGKPDRYFSFSGCVLFFSSALYSSAAIEDSTKSDELWRNVETCPQAHIPEKYKLACAASEFSLRWLARFGVETAADVYDCWIWPILHIKDKKVSFDKIEDNELVALVRDIWLIICEYAVSQRRLVAAYHEPARNMCFRIGYALGLAPQPDFSRALRFLDRALEYSPLCPILLGNRAYLLLNLNRKPKALLATTHALTSQRKSAWILEIKARVLLAMRLYDLAHDCASQAINAFKDLPSIMHCEKLLNDIDTARIHKLVLTQRARRHPRHSSHPIPFSRFS